MSFELIGLVAVIILATILFVHNKKTLDQYKSEIKSGQDKIEKFMGQINDKNILVERAAVALQDANKQIQVLSNYLSVSNGEIQSLKQTLDFQNNQYQKLLGQKKSSEVRVGLVAEQMACFLRDYPFPSDTGKFLGQPVDLIHFLDDKIVIVEIKSGNSQLSSKQRKIRDQIKNGKVEFYIHRIEGEE